MKRIIERILKAVVGLLMFGCVFGGIILMMCETPDWKRQVSTMALGFALFCIGIMPGAVISLMASRKERRRNGIY